MAEHCSIELARDLQVAGLRRDWQQGDWYIWDSDYVGRDVRLVHSAEIAAWFNAPPKLDRNCPLFLPRADDLLQELAKAGVTCGTLGTEDSQEWYVGMTTVDIPLIKHASLAEAAGQALLAVLQAGGQG